MRLKNWRVILLYVLGVGVMGLLGSIRAHADTACFQWHRSGKPFYPQFSQEQPEFSCYYTPYGGGNLVYKDFRLSFGKDMPSSCIGTDGGSSPTPLVLYQCAQFVNYGSPKSDRQGQFISTYVAVAEEAYTHQAGTGTVTEYYYVGEAGASKEEAERNVMAKCNEKPTYGTIACSLTGSFIDAGTIRFGHGSVGGE